MQHYEEEQEFLWGVNERSKSFLNMSINAAGANSKLNQSMASSTGANSGMKSHRFNRAVIEEEKKVKKLHLENSMLTEKLKAINF